MPMRQKPEPGEIETEPFTPGGLDAEGPFYEYFDLKIYFDPRDGAECRKAATKTTLSGKEKKEEIDLPFLWKLVSKKQMVGWRSIVPTDKSFDAKTMYLEQVQDEKGVDIGTVAFWKFIESNIDKMPEDVHLTIYNEVMARGAFIASRSLLTKGPDGRDVTFRRADAKLDGKHLHDVSAGVGDSVLSDAESGVGVSTTESGVLAESRPRVDKRPRGNAEGAKRSG